ncbi:metallopeptidase TldD-related protein [Streptomyces sp. NPDC058280]|uniref:metallopeptidase TldD-related protein n=1 Tax=Streptomyces sp. NPDC058280 TaxID=3346419 RepID=UPI0036ECCC1E
MIRPTIPTRPVSDGPPAGPERLSAEDLAEYALGLCRADACVVVVEDRDSVHLRWSESTVTTSGSARGRLLTVIAVEHRGSGGTSVGVVRCSDTSRDRIAQAVAAAEAAARAATPVPGALPLPAPAGGPVDWPAPAQERTGPEHRAHERAARFVPALGRAFEAARAHDRLLFGFAEEGSLTTWMATSSGLRLRGDQPFGRVELTAKSADLTRSAWTAAPVRTLRADGLTGMADDLLRRMSRGDERRELPPGRYDVLLSPSAAGEMALNLYRAAGARAAHDGRGPFTGPGGTNRVGEQLTPYPLNLRSDPHHPDLPCPPFLVVPSSGRDSSVFDNGLPLTATDWIRDGTLRALVQTRESAVLTGLPCTPAAGNLILEGPGRATLDDMVARTARGLLITSLWYVRTVDPNSGLLTGVTRDGVYLVEHGEIVAEVNNFRFNESPVAMLGRVTEAGATSPALSREWDPYAMPLAAPPLRVSDFNLSSVSRST